MLTNEKDKVLAVSGLTPRDRAVVFALTSVLDAKVSLLWVVVCAFGFVAGAPVVERFHHGELALAIVCGVLGALHGLRWLNAHLSFRENSEKVRTLDAAARDAWDEAHRLPAAFTARQKMATNAACGKDGSS